MAHEHNPRCLRPVHRGEVGLQPVELILEHVGHLVEPPRVGVDGGKMDGALNDDVKGSKRQTKATRGKQAEATDDSIKVRTISKEYHLEEPELCPPGLIVSF